MANFINPVFRGTVANDNTGDVPYNWSGKNNTNDLNNYNHVPGYNLIEQGVPLESASDWSTYNDVAATLPVDGVGGVANITFVRNTSSPIFGSADFKLTKDGVNRQGQGASATYTVPEAVRGQQADVCIDFKRTGGTLVSNDISIAIYDVTNGAVLTPVIGSQFNVGNVGQIRYVVNIPASCAQFRFCIHIASTSTSAYDVQFQHVKLQVSSIYRNPESPFLVGELRPYTGLTVPNGNWLSCLGQEVNIADYPELYKIYVTDPGFTNQTCTFNPGSPGTVTRAGHGLVSGMFVHLNTTGTLPSGLSTTLRYMVEVIDANTFYLVDPFGAWTTGGTLEASRWSFSGPGSGTLSYVRTLYGLGNRTTTFNVPNLSRRGLSGFANGDTNTPGGNWFSSGAGFIGALWGKFAHTLGISEMPAHTHNSAITATGVGGPTTWPNGQNNPGPNYVATTSTGGSGSHQQASPTLSVHMLVRAKP